MQNSFEIDSSFSSLSLKRFETGKPFNPKENEKFCQMALQCLKKRLIKKGLENGKKEN